jgi:hypothetical protein
MFSSMIYLIHNRIEGEKYKVSWEIWKFAKNHGIHMAFGMPIKPWIMMAFPKLGKSCGPNVSSQNHDQYKNNKDN